MTRISNRHSASFKTRLIHLKTKEKRFSNRDSPVVFATAPEPVGIGYTESALKKTLSENALRVVREVTGAYIADRRAHNGGVGIIYRASKPD